MLADAASATNSDLDDDSGICFNPLSSHHHARSCSGKKAIKSGHEGQTTPQLPKLDEEEQMEMELDSPRVLP